MRQITLDDIDHLTLGATLLGTGGGGDPYIGALMARQAIEEHGPVRVVDAAALPPDGLVAAVAIVGAPTVIIERVPAGREFAESLRALSRYLGRELVAIMPIEVGGMNTLIPVASAAELNLPLINADGMGRAFPEIEMTVFTLAGLAATPITVADEKGNLGIFETVDNKTAEVLGRTAVVQLGMANAVTQYPMTARQCAESAITGSLSYCLRLGGFLASARDGGAATALDELLDFAGGRRVFAGKVVDVDRRATDGFTRGHCDIEHFDDPTRTLRLLIQNELLVALDDGRPVVTPPDLICVLDQENAQPITTETLAYGQRVEVVALPAAPRWRRDGFLELVGPAAFGYDIDYVPFGGRN
ncbi:DUF917 domain-containing protein [Pseudonocardia acaciae]|uniref:DUF917 domain-containing protein n=1 Tax=Pseudonocardia acaciae TaxID=551276 RepID=UPI000490A0C6|nr:DUF917 domain-containing protein [Pseudonocardia acaciae]